MISELCCNENSGFPYKISSVNELSEELLISQFMLFNLFKKVFLILTKLWQCSKKCALDSIFTRAQRIYAIFKIMIKPMFIQMT